MSRPAGSDPHALVQNLRGVGDLSGVAALLAAGQLYGVTGIVLTESVLPAGPRVTAANPAFARMMGCSVEDLAGRMLEFGEPRTGRALIERFCAELGTGRSAQAELLVYRADGSDLWLEADAAPLGDDQGGAGRVLIVARDVTERREIERRLGVTGELLEMATAAGGVGIWEWEPATERVRWNSALRQLVGIDESEPASPQRWLELVHPDDRDAAHQAIDSLYAKGESSHRIVRPDGEVRQVVVRSERISGAGDEPHLVGMVIDVTETHRAASQVAETLESITDGYFSLDRSWCFTYVNQPAERLIGASRAELLGKNLWEWFPATIGTNFEGYRAAMDRQEIVSFEEYYEPLLTWFEVKSYPTPHGISVYFSDVTDRHAAEAERSRLLEAEQAARRAAETAQAKLERQATQDALTDLLNRWELLRRLDAAIAARASVTALFIDLDRFKLVNDSLGHATGDAMLRKIAGRLAPLSDRGHIVARLGGDEFVVGLIDSDRHSIEVAAEYVRDVIRQPVDLTGNILHTTASIGIAEARPFSAAADLLRDADVALYRAKDAGRDQVMWFDEHARRDLLERVQIEGDLRAALTTGALSLHYQPAFDLRTGHATDVEALLRWQHSGRGMISPATFIPVAEESGLIHPLGEWVLATAASTASMWDRNAGGPTLWANVSARQLAHRGLAEALKGHLAAAGLDPDRFGIEITESVLAENDSILHELQHISDLGVKIAVDDFGTGYSSISRLKDLPVHVLKIDQSFIKDIDASRGIETVAAIVDLGHALDTIIIAEGVETREQVAALRMTGCDKASGYLLAHPAPVEHLAAAVRDGAQLLQSW